MRILDGGDGVAQGLSGGEEIHTVGDMHILVGGIGGTSLYLPAQTLFSIEKSVCSDRKKLVDIYYQKLTILLIQS